MSRDHTEAPRLLGRRANRGAQKHIETSPQAKPSADDDGRVDQLEAPRLLGMRANRGAQKHIENFLQAKLNADDDGRVEPGATSQRILKENGADALLLFLRDVTRQVIIEAVAAAKAKGESSSAPLVTAELVERTPTAWFVRHSRRPKRQIAEVPFDDAAPLQPWLGDGECEDDPEGDAEDDAEGDAEGDDRGDGEEEGDESGEGLGTCAMMELDRRSPQHAPSADDNDGNNGGDNDGEWPLIDLCS
eukprot:Amastigsp_a340163_16.p1 type:complete len:247 gc:universal Amastigsp_a340163_16:78-818(+)